MTYFLTSGRLGFRQWTEADLPLAVALWADPEVMNHMGGAMFLEAVTARLTLEMERHRDHNVQYWPMFLLAGGQHVGCAGLRPFHGSMDVMEMGVHVARPFWSQRIGEEAARAVIDHGWRTTGAHALVAGHGPGNVNSKAMIERLGFRYTHHEPWGSDNILHPFYRLERPRA